MLNLTHFSLEFSIFRKCIYIFFQEKIKKLDALALFPLKVIQQE